MAELQQTIQRTQARRDAWSEMATQKFSSSSDVYSSFKPASSWQNYDATRKRGFIEGFFQGVKDEPDYVPTMSEAIGASLTEFARSATEVGVEVFDPQRKELRANIEVIRRTDPQLADDMEASIGKRLSNEQLTRKGIFAVAEGALTVLPFFKVGRAGLAVVEAQNAARLAKLGSMGARLAASPTFRNFSTGGLYGAIYGGLYEGHVADDLDFKDLLKTAAIGGATGGALAGFGGIAVRTAAKGTRVVGTAFKTTAEVLAANVPDFIKAPTNPVGRKVYETIFSVGSNMERYYGDIGKNFVKMYQTAVRTANTDIGRVQLGMIENGLIKPPAVTAKAFKGVEFVGDNVELMSQYNRVLRGQGVYSDPIVRAKAIAADPRLEFLDLLRKDYGTKAQQSGVTETLLDLDTYLPKHTPEVELSKVTRAKLAGLSDDAAREAAFAKNDEMVKEMVENSVFNEKAFKTLNEAYEAYYDYVDFVVHGGRIRSLQNNSYLRHMVTKGEAATLEEAAGKIIADLKFKKQSLTPLAASLDFRRQVNLPWFDPNPARVLSVYSVDSAVRLQMAKTFGANDEVIHKMINDIRTDPVHGTEAIAEAKKFEHLVRVVTGQVERSALSERASAFVRALNIPKLAFAQILNVGQSLNTLLASDISSTAHGLSTLFREEQMRKAIESGVLHANFMREIFSYSTGGQKYADKFLQYSGFTWTEMFNRAAGAVAAEKWASRNFAAYMKAKGLSLSDDAGKATVVKMLENSREFERRVRLGGIEVQKQLLATFKQKFPDEDFQAAAGDLRAVRKRLAKMDDAYEGKIGKLQKSKSVLEKELSATAQPMTDQYVKDLQEAIGLYRAEIKRATPAALRVQEEGEPVRRFTQEEIQQSVDAAVRLRRETMGKIVEKLEEKFNEVRSLGTSFSDMPPAAQQVIGEVEKLTPDEKLGQSVGELGAAVREVDAEILRLTNEWSEKQSILENIQDAYKISEEKLAREFPEGLEYQKYLAGQRRKAGRKAMQFYSPNEEENLDFAEATLRLESENHKRFRMVTDDIDRNLSLKGEAFDAIGDWSDGAENTIYKEFTEVPDYDTLRYSAALKGKRGNQKAVIPFIVEEGGPDSVYRFTVEDSMNSVRRALDEAGLEFRTLIPTGKNQVDVVVFDSGSQLQTNVAGLNQTYGRITVEQYRGRGEFLGSFDTRADGARIYNSVIGEFERGGGTAGAAAGGDAASGVRGRETRRQGLPHRAVGIREEAILKELGVNVEEAALRGFLSQDDLIQAAQSFVDATQFGGRTIDLPQFASSPMGKVLFQFKTFAYQQIRFLSKQIKTDMVSRETRSVTRAFRNLFVLGAIFPMTGEVIADIRSLVTGSKRPTKFFDRYMDNLASAGAYGLLWDFWKSAEAGREAEFVAGPTLSEAMRFLEQTAVPALKGDVDRAGTNFSKQLLQSTGVGRIGVNALYPNRVQGESTWDALKEWTGYDEE